jgi:hypothetical protein
MKRTAIGAVAGLAIWFGSALAAEAQVVQPQGPMCITAGSTAPTFTATVTIPTANYFYVRVQVYLNGNCIHNSQTFVPNPGTTTYNFSKVTQLTTAPQVGQTLTFSSTLIYAGKSYTGTNWNVVVTGTRPTSKGAAIQRTSLLAIQGIDRDRRRE